MYTPIAAFASEIYGALIITERTETQGELLVVMLPALYTSRVPWCREMEFTPSVAALVSLAV